MLLLLVHNVVQHPHAARLLVEVRYYGGRRRTTRVLLFPQPAVRSGFDMSFGRGSNYVGRGKVYWFTGAFSSFP